MTTVIVQSDSLAPWIGVIGVVVGALLGAMSSLIQGRLREARKRRDELRNATDDLRAGADGLHILVEAYLNGGDSQALIDWIPLIMTQYERVQRANEAISRLGGKDLRESSESLTGIALKYASPEGSNVEALEKAIGKFTEKVTEEPRLRGRGGVRRHDP